MIFKMAIDLPLEMDGAFVNDDMVDYEYFISFPEFKKAIEKGK
jgi:hypothetical protein